MPTSIMTLPDELLQLIFNMIEVGFYANDDYSKKSHFYANLSLVNRKWFWLVRPLWLRLYLEWQRQSIYSEDIKNLLSEAYENIPCSTSVTKSDEWKACSICELPSVLDRLVPLTGQLEFQKTRVKRINGGQTVISTSSKMFQVEFELGTLFAAHLELSYLWWVRFGTPARPSFEWWARFDIPVQSSFVQAISEMNSSMMSYPFPEKFLSIWRNSFYLVEHFLLYPLKIDDFFSYAYMDPTLYGAIRYKLCEEFGVVSTRIADYAQYKTTLVHQHPLMGPKAVVRWIENRLLSVFAGDARYDQLLLPPLLFSDDRHSITALCRSKFRLFCVELGEQHFGVVDNDFVPVELRHLIHYDTYHQGNPAMTEVDCLKCVLVISKSMLVADSAA